MHTRGWGNAQGAMARYRDDESKGGLRLGDLSRSVEDLLARGVAEASLFCRACASLFRLDLRAVPASPVTAYRDLVAVGACACADCGSKDVVMLPPGLDAHLARTLRRRDC